MFCLLQHLEHVAYPFFSLLDSEFECKIDAQWMFSNGGMDARIDAWAMEGRAFGWISDCTGQWIEGSLHAGKEPWHRPDFSSPTIMDFPASRTVRTKCLLFKSPSVGHFVKAFPSPPQKRQFVSAYEYIFAFSSKCMWACLCLCAGI